MSLPGGETVTPAGTLEGKRQVTAPLWLEFPICKLGGKGWLAKPSSGLGPQKSPGEAVTKWEQMLVPSHTTVLRTLLLLPV
jgi:hypothetical protein